MKVAEYLKGDGTSPFGRWFDSLDAQIAAKATTAIIRMELGNPSNVKGIGGGVFEYRMHFGAGYRIYLGKDGGTIIILLGGGTKRRQQKDIEVAKRIWQEYKQRKKEGR